MNQHENPPWLGPGYDFAWDHVKLEMERRLKAGSGGGSEINSLLCQSPFREFETPIVLVMVRVGNMTKNTPKGTINWRRICIKTGAMFPRREQEWQQDCLAIQYGWNYASEELQGIADREVTPCFEPAGNAMRKNMKIKNIITPPPGCISPNASAAEAAVEMKAS